MSRENLTGNCVTERTDSQTNGSDFMSCFIAKWCGIYHLVWPERIRGIHACETQNRLIGLHGISVPQQTEKRRRAFSLYLLKLSAYPVS